jgi:hypothetical protein
VGCGGEEVFFGKQFRLAEAKLEAGLEGGRRFPVPGWRVGEGRSPSDAGVGSAECRGNGKSGHRRTAWRVRDPP